LFANVSFTEAQVNDYSIIDAYELLLAQENSNFGWRMLAELELSERQLQGFLRASLDGTPFSRLLPQDFVEKHDSVIEVLRAEQLSEDDHLRLIQLLGDQADILVKHFYPIEDENPQTIDETQPTVLLTSFEGCKGLSAGHVFVVGLNDGVVPKVQDNQVDEIDCCRFIVALTRTRKQCYLLSNRWDYGPVGKKPFERSVFLLLIPKEYIAERGYLASKDIID